MPVARSNLALAWEKASGTGGVAIEVDELRVKRITGLFGIRDDSSL